MSVLPKSEGGKKQTYAYNLDPSFHYHRSPAIFGQSIQYVQHFRVSLVLAPHRIEAVTNPKPNRNLNPNPNCTRGCITRYGASAALSHQVTHQVRPHLLWRQSTERVWPEGQADWLVHEVAHRDLPLCIETILERVNRIAADYTLW